MSQNQRMTVCSSSANPGLAAQYATMRAAHDLSDERLAELARMSLRASRAPESDVARWLGEVDDWLG